MSKNRKNGRGGTKRGNARTARGRHKLNVRATSKRARRAEWGGRWRTALKWGAGAAFVVVLFLGVRRAVDHFLYESPKFKVATIDYHTDGTLTRARVLGVAGAETGQNILRVNLEELRERVIEALPSVREVEIIRDLPDRLEFRVEERKPIAWLADIDRTSEPSKRRDGLLLDREGVVVPCARLESDLVDLPVVYSDDLAAAKPGKGIDNKPVLAALSLIGQFGGSFEDSPVELETIRVSSSTSLVGELNTGTVVTFGLDEFERQLDNLRVVIAEATRRGKALAEANVAPRRNVAVRFRDPLPAPHAALVGTPPNTQPDIVVEPAPAAPRALPVNPAPEAPNPPPTTRKKVYRSVPGTAAGRERTLRSILRVD